MQKHTEIKKDKKKHTHTHTTCKFKDKVLKVWDNYQYPLLQGFFWMLDGQYDPPEQNTSLLLKTSAHLSAPPQVWFDFPGGR